MLLSFSTINAEVHSAPAKATGPELGSTLPELMLSSGAEEKAAIKYIAKEKGVVLVVFRGAWCPYCQRHLAALSKIVPKIEKAGYKTIAFGTDKASSIKEMKDSAGIELYGDEDLSAAKALNLAYYVDEKTITRYRGYGIPLIKDGEEKGEVLPVPAVLVYSPEGKLTYKYLNLDYSQRMDPAELLKQL